MPQIREGASVKQGREEETTKLRKVLLTMMQGQVIGIYLGMLRDLCNDYNLKRAEKTKRQLEQGVISRVEAEWCCRCKVMTSSFQEKCLTQYCEHRRCPCCRDFNRVGEAEIGVSHSSREYYPS